MARGRGAGYVQNAQRRLAIQRGRLRGGAPTAARGRGRGKLGKSPMPFDSQAQRESAELGAEGADSRAALAAGYAKAQNALGFGTGVSNPYGATAENEKALTENQRGIGTAAGNSLYAGSTLNAQSQARSSFDKTQTGIEGEINEAEGEYTGGVAKTARDEALAQAGIKEGAIERAAATEPKPLGVGRGRTGRGRLAGPNEARNVRRPAAARAANAQARAIRKRLAGTAPVARGRI